MPDWLERNARWIAVPGLFAVLLFAAAFLSEWHAVGVEADPATVEAYHFGSEAMVGHGGDHYRTAEAYASRMLTGGLAALGVAGVLVFGLVRRSGIAVATGYVVVAAVLIVGLVS
ncbi:hypothetical protein [Rubrivirga sp. IMCC45206]|uniref:hypothetical protein n=1 Tax=Rubrivirga sp. IMCC45206 TaxID=3391614 RepID=UPI00398F9CB5